MKSEWNFDETIRGTLRGGRVELDLAGLRDGDDGEWDMEDDDPAEQDEAEDEEMWGTTRVKSDIMEGVDVDISSSLRCQADSSVDVGSDITAPRIIPSPHP
jgi:hypothetical protein